MQGSLSWVSWWQDELQSFKQGGPWAPWMVPSLRVTFHPLNHDGLLALGSSMLSPLQAKIGTKATVSGLRPIFLM